MAITQVGSATGAGTNGAATATVTKPTGVVNDDILLAFIARDAGTANVVTPPTGWTLIRDTNDGGGVTIGMSSYWKRASGEGANYAWVFPGSDGAALITAWRGCIGTGTPIDVNSGGPTTGNSVNIDAPTLTPTLTDDLLLCGYVIDNGGAAVSTISVNATLTNLGTQLSGGSLTRVSVGSLQLTSAAATGLKRSTAGASQAATAGQQITLISGVVDQFVSPISDVTLGSWTPTPLYPNIDEATVDDSNYITSGSNPVSDVCEVAFDILNDPSVSTGHIVYYRYRKAGNAGKQVDLQVDLVQGTTVIATWTHTDIGVGIQQKSQTLTGTQADSITDYTDLRLRFTANAP
jgi:hypothetical protein